jgi:endonuclease/exonuclease/phosphatase family metal-dependent hydrolase
VKYTQLILVLLGFLLWACSHTTPKIQPTPTKTLRVATFNVHRLFDLVCDSKACGPDEYEALPTQEEFSLRISQIAKAIQQLEADVVILQEVESQASLDALNAELHFPVSILGETNTPASVDVAILAKGELRQVFTHRQNKLTLADGTTTTFARELLELQLTVKGSEVFVLGAHLRSKVKDDPARRLAEAETINKILSERIKTSPKALVVFGGDLNDTPGSETLQSIELGGFVTRVAQDLGEAAATFIYHGQGLALDHLYLAKTMFGAYLGGSAKIYRDDTGGFGGSDHAALSADFVLTP